MKIQKLVIHNIASIENAEIDFAASPLSDSDVFLITGPTGSGKSTILDAICLALYGTTPRLSNTLMEGSVDVAGKDVQLDNPAQLLRKTTGEGYVKLSFEGTDGIPYEVEWSIARARGKADGRLQPRKWEVTDLHSGMTYTKEGEIKAEIAKAVGLSFDQFCRTTMLAQGQFTRFLDSKDEEKAEILEMITGADIYSKIGVKVFEITRDKEAEYGKAKEALQGITLLSEEEKAAKESSIEGNKTAIKSYKKAQNEAKGKADWLDREAELVTEKGKADTALSEAREATKTEDFIREGNLIKAYRDTTQVRGELAIYTKQSGHAKEAEVAIAGLAETYKSVKSGQLWLLDKKEQIASSLGAVQEVLREEEPISGVIAKAEALYSQLDIIETGVTTVNSLKEGIETKEKTVQETLTPAFSNALAKEEETKKTKGEKAAALKAAEDALTAVNLPEIRKQSASLLSLQGKITLAKERLKTVKETWKTRQTEKNAIETKEKETEGKKNTLAAMQGEVKALQGTMNATQRVFEAERSAKENVVGDMRRKLQVGDFCPVCMQEIVAALPTDAEVDARLKPIEDDYTMAKDAYDKRKEELDQLSATILAEQGQLSERKRKYETDKTLANQKADLIEALKDCGIESFDADTEYKLGEMAEQVRQRKEAVDRKEAAGKLLEDNVTKARSEDTLAGKAYDTAREMRQNAEKALTDANSAIETDRAVMNTQKSAVNAAALEVDKIVKGTQWETEWRKGFKTFRSEVERAVEAHNDSVKKEANLTEGLRALSQETRITAQSLLEIEKIAPAWAEFPIVEKVSLDELSTQASSLKDKLLVENQNLSTAKAAASDAWAKVAAFLSSHPEFSKAALDVISGYTDAQIAAAEENQKGALKTVQNAEGAVTSFEKQMKEHAEKKPAFEEGDTVESLRDLQAKMDEAILGKTGDIVLLEDELKTDEENKRKSGELSAKVDALRVERDKWAKLNEMIGDGTGKKFRKIAQSYVLGSLVSAANFYMKELSDRYTLEVIPGTFVILLEDAYQGFEKRPACTSSGGEGFLVSLALALALSDIGDSLSVDTLFIDEGFGTLSGEPLQNAINTLKTLRKKAGRHVGIISHIEEVREKIPVKIMLEQDNRTASSMVRVVPEE